MYGTPRGSAPTRARADCARPPRGSIMGQAFSAQPYHVSLGELWCCLGANNRATSVSATSKLVIRLWIPFYPSSQVVPQFCSHRASYTVLCPQSFVTFIEPNLAGQTLSIASGELTHRSGPVGKRNSSTKFQGLVPQEQYLPRELHSLPRRR